MTTTISPALHDILRAESSREFDEWGPRDFGDPESEYQALSTGATLTPLARTVLRMGGADRVKILNNLTTNDVKRLQPGQGCETFLTDVKGHALGFLTVYALAESFLLETAPGQADRILPHVDRYVIREKIELADLSKDRAVLHLMGPQAEARLREWLGSDGGEVPAEPLASTEVTLSDLPALLVRYDLRGAKEAEQVGYRLICDAASAADAWRTLRGVGFRPCGQASFEAARVRARFPEFGRDVTAENLPQEAARDKLAISFTKGCYLGQETVARIDAMGHVNKTLVRLHIAAGEAKPGLELFGPDGKPAGRLTSVAVIPGEAGALALGYVRMGTSASGTKLTSETAAATVL